MKKFKRIKKGGGLNQFSASDINRIHSILEGIEGIGCRIVKGDKKWFIVVDGVSTDVEQPESTTTLQDAFRQPFDVRAIAASGGASYDVQIWVPAKIEGLVTRNADSVSPLESMELEPGAWNTVGNIAIVDTYTVWLKIVPNPKYSKPSNVRTAVWESGHPTAARWMVEVTSGYTYIDSSTIDINETGTPIAVIVQGVGSPPVVHQMRRGGVSTFFVPLDSDENPTTGEFFVPGNRSLGYSRGIGNQTLSNGRYKMIELFKFDYAPRPVIGPEDFDGAAGNYSVVIREETDEGVAQIAYEPLFLFVEKMAEKIASCLKVTIGGTDYDIDKKD